MSKNSHPINGIHPYGLRSEVRVFGVAERWIKRKEKLLIFAVLLLSLIVSLLLFDSKVSPGGDDSAYIERAWQLAYEGKFPYFQGPGYPVFLSLIIKMVGLNVWMLKVFSVLCQLLFVWFSYLAFRRRVPYFVLFSLLLFLSSSYYIQYYSSQTFTEAFFLMIQSMAVYVVFRIIDSLKNLPEGFVEAFKINSLNWMIFGLVFCLLSVSKSVAIIAIAGVVIYFLFNRNYKEAIFALLVFVLLRMLVEWITGSIYGPDQTNQLELMMRKDLYKPALGHEDLPGLIVRFFDNFNTYLSLHLYRMLHLRSADALMIFPPLAYLTAVAFGLFTFLSYRRNQYIFFSGIYLIVLSCAVFSGVHAGNMQDRLIIIVIPFFFIVMIYGLSLIARRSGTAQYVVMIFTGFILLTSLGFSLSRSYANIESLKKNLSGDVYYGYTPDWENFLRMSEFCSDSVPEGLCILSRKPNMSFIYGDGRKFVGQYWATTTHPDSVLMAWKEQQIKYVILGSLRLDPKVADGRIINTIHRMIDPVREKYPEKLRVVKTIGEEEKCELIEISY